MMLQTIAIILAGGSGTRLGSAVPKAFVEVAGQTLLVRAVATFATHPAVDAVIVVAPRTHMRMARTLLKSHNNILAIVAGGESRAASLAAGLRKVPHDALVVTANVANIFTTKKEITAVVQVAKKYAAAAVGRRAVSTVKIVKHHRVIATPDRQKIWLTETPQAVRADVLRRGLRIAQQELIEPTDDVQLAELAGVRPVIVPADPQNFKITTADDLARAAAFFAPIDVRVGFGHDSHRFELNIKKPLVLGGVRIAHPHGLAGNSDADVVLHALVNALSSAVGGGSISTYADDLCAAGECDSRAYVRVVLKKVRTAGYVVGNVSISLEAATPKLEKQLSRLNRAIAAIVGVSVDRVGVTATSGERLTAFGRGEGIQAFALVTLYPSSAAR